MGKQQFSVLTVLILLFFALSTTIGYVSAASDLTNSTVLSEPASDPVKSDLINYLTPKDPNTGYIAVIDIKSIEVSLEHIVIAYIPTLDLKDGKISDSYLADPSDASGDSNPIDLSSLGISTTKPTGDPTIISTTAGNPVISDPVTSYPVASDSTTTRPSNTENSYKGSCKPSRCKSTTDRSPTTSKPTTDSKTSTCKPTTSNKPATISKISKCAKPVISKASSCKPATSKTSICKPKTTSAKPETGNNASKCKPKTSKISNSDKQLAKSTSTKKPSTCSKKQKHPLPTKNSAGSP
jgi:hypothetical protein